MKKIFALIFVCLLAVSVFAGCSGSKTAETTAATEAAQADTQAAQTDGAAYAAVDGEAADVTGMWISTSYVDAEGTEYTIDEYAEKYGVTTEEIISSYTLEEDGTVVGTVGDLVNEGTYTFDGETLTVTFPGGETKFTYDAALDAFTATDEASGVTAILTRANV